jgi:hypothetical protein
MALSLRAVENFDSLPKDYLQLAELAGQIDSLYELPRIENSDRKQ